MRGLSEAESLYICLQFLETFSLFIDKSHSLFIKNRGFWLIDFVIKNFSSNVFQIVEICPSKMDFRTRLLEKIIIMERKLFPAKLLLRKLFCNKKFFFWKSSKCSWNASFDWVSGQENLPLKVYDKKIKIENFSRSFWGK